jgi:hypothetical protein
MNDHRANRDAPLIAGAFHDDWATGPTAEFARRAAAHARRRRARGHLLLATTATVAVGLASFVAAHRPATPVPTIAAQPVAAQPAYEIISDEQLLAALKDQAVLVVKQADGTNQITLLEPPDETPLPSRGEE